MVSFTITGSDSGTQITVVVNGVSYALDDTHVSFQKIYDSLVGDTYDESTLLGLLSPTKEILRSFNGKVTIDGGTVYYNGEAMYNRFSNTMLDFYRKGLPVGKLLNFMEKLMNNPSRNSREQFYEFLNLHNFSITENGDFLAYKGVNNDFTAITAGPGVVNGEVFSDSSTHLDNTPGNHLEIERREVVDNPGVGCAFGLHVGSYEYASHFGPTTVEVIVNPEDIVSVPNDSHFQKVRVCRYTVLRVVGAEVQSSDRYDTVDSFISWLQGIVAPYSRKGKVASSFRELANRFLSESGDEIDTNALDSFVAEIEGRKLTSHNVYRYHVDSLISDYLNTEEEDENVYYFDDDLSDWDEENEDNY